MEDLKARLDAIKTDIQQLERVTRIIQRQAGILESIDRVNKEVS